MNYKKLEKKLNELKEKFKENEESWIKISGFENYEISTFGRIKSLPTIETRKFFKTGILKAFVKKELILKPLYVGIDRKWVAARLVIKKNTYKQYSLAKLLLSSFLGIKIEKLPRSIYFINGDSHEVNLFNLTFIYMNKDSKKK